MSEGEQLTKCGTKLREIIVLESAKLRGSGDLKSIFTSDMGMQSLEFVQLVFGWASVKCFNTMLHFWSGIL